MLSELKQNFETFENFAVSKHGKQSLKDGVKLELAIGWGIATYLQLPQIFTTICRTPGLPLDVSAYSSVYGCVILQLIFQSHFFKTKHLWNSATVWA